MFYQKQTINAIIMEYGIVKEQSVVTKQKLIWDFIGVSELYEMVLRVNSILKYQETLCRIKKMLRFDRKS